MGISAAIVSGLEFLGAGAGFAEAAAPIIAGVGEGALAGGAIGEVTTGKPLTGAIEGGITGGVLSGVGPVISDATGIGLTGTDAALGAGVGAAESAVTHTNPLTGALEGGVGGALTGAFAGSPSTTPDAAPGVTGGTPVAGGTTLGSAAGSGVAGGAAAPAAAVGPSLTGGFSPDAVSGGSNVLSQLGAAPAGSPTTPSFFVDDGGASGIPPTGSAASANSQFLDAPPAAAGTAGPSTANVGALSGVAGDAGTSGLSGLLDKLGIGDSNTDWISAPNAAKYGLGGAVAAYDLSKPGLTATPGYSALTGEAATLGAQGAQLQSYVNNGTLPPGAKTAVDQATQQAIATIKSKYASMGQSGSTSEASAIASVQQQAAEEGFQIANQLLSSGISESQLASGIYQTILNANVSQNNEVTSAITGLAGALGGGGTTVRVT